MHVSHNKRINIRTLGFRGMYVSPDNIHTHMSDIGLHAFPHIYIGLCGKKEQAIVGDEAMNGHGISGLCQSTASICIYTGSMMYVSYVRRLRGHAHTHIYIYSSFQE